MSPQPRRPFPRALVTVAVLGVVMSALLLAFRPSLQVLWAEWQNRSPQELIRYAMRRLEGHTKLETVLLPPLTWLQRHYEREPNLSTIPSMGKGQQSKLHPGPASDAQVWHVDTPQGIREALSKATAGTYIVVRPGLYLFDRNLYLGQDGTATAPITLMALQPGSVWFEFTQLDGILVNRPHWVFENLNIRGTCAQQHNCEHAFHVTGRASHTTIRNNLLVDFNAHIKVNGHQGEWPDHGLAAWNTLVNHSPRNTDRSVTPFDLVGANHWVFSQNLVANFVKVGSNRVSYGVFMKGASEGGLISDNVVICTPKHISQKGIRVGISFGGGGTGAEYCRDGNCKAHEHARGAAIRNIIAHCNDSGLDLNKSQDILLSRNLLINTSGLTLRNHSRALAEHNMFEGTLALRDRSTVHLHTNRNEDAHEWFSAPDALDGSLIHELPLTK